MNVFLLVTLSTFVDEDRGSIDFRVLILGRLVLDNLNWLRHPS